MSDPVTNNDLVGVAGIGTQETHTNTYGSKWQMAIAVPIRNRKFEWGTILNFTIAADPFSTSGAAANCTQIGISASSKNMNSFPSNFLQYGDKAVIGPSSDTTDENRTEKFRILGVGESSPVNGVWSNGVIYCLDRRNKYDYNNSDSITIYGSGQADSWFATNAMTSTKGIKKGYSSLNIMGRISVNKGNNYTTGIGQWENSFDSNFIGLSIMLPAHASFPVNTDMDEIDVGCSLFFSNLGLGPYRSINYQGSPEDYDWSGATTAATLAYQGVFRYVYKHNESAYAKFAFNTNSATPLSENLFSKNTYSAIMTGFEHPGGQYKDFAQSLFTMVNNISATSGISKVSTSRFYQLLSANLSETKDMQFAPMPGGTYYRCGITWKGNLYPDNATNVANSTSFMKFQFGPIAQSNDVNTYSSSMITTDELLSDSSRSQSTWKTNMASAWVETIDTDDLDTWENLRLEIVSHVSSPTTYQTARQNRGAEMMLYVDSVFLEHEGGITGASNKGYVEIDHYPEQGTLMVDRMVTSKPNVIILPNGTRISKNTTGTQDKYYHEITCDFARVDITIYRQFLALQRWQDKGYNLVLHPFLPEVPFALVGQMNITNVSKSFWDLNKFTFRFSFIETE